MKILYDTICINQECENVNQVVELFKKQSDEFPNCPICGEQLIQTHTKTASFELSGGGVFSPGKKYSI